MTITKNSSDKIVIASPKGKTCEDCIFFKGLKCHLKPPVIFVSQHYVTKDILPSVHNYYPMCSEGKSK